MTTYLYLQRVKDAFSAKINISDLLGRIRNLLDLSYEQAQNIDSIHIDNQKGIAEITANGSTHSFETYKQ